MHVCTTVLVCAYHVAIRAHAQRPPLLGRVRMRKSGCSVSMTTQATLHATLWLAGSRFAGVGADSIMPLKLRVRRRKKAGGGGDGDTASVASAASKPESKSRPASLRMCGWTQLIM